MAEPAGGVGFGDRMKGVADADEATPSASPELSQDGFGLGPGELDWIKIRRIGRKELEAALEQRCQKVAGPNPHRLGVHAPGRSSGACTPSSERAAMMVNGSQRRPGT